MSASTVRAVEQAVIVEARDVSTRVSLRPFWLWLAGTLIAFALGSWLVWLSAYLQRTFAEEDIRRACRHVMPETADRCFDTVVIQRGGVRR